MASRKLFVKGLEKPPEGTTLRVRHSGDRVSPWNQFNVGYYLFALIFLIFDVGSSAFMYPWAVVVKHLGLPALVEILIFLFILFMGFLYAHKKGALKWV